MSIGSLFSRVGSALSNLVPDAVERRAAGAVDGVAELGRDVYVGARQTSRKVVTSVTHADDVAKTWKTIFGALRTGEYTVLPGEMPPYPELDPALRRQAVAAGAGRTVAQGLLSSDPAGEHVHDPVNLIVRGSKQDLVGALERQGWVQAEASTAWSEAQYALAVLFRLGRETEGPVSEQYLDGKPADMAFNKNSDFGIGRDHLRIYHRGQDPQTGEDVWAIAAIRDIAVTMQAPRETNGKRWPWQWDWQKPKFNHRVDAAIDGERDLVLHDMLASGLVREWAAVDGVLPDGRSKVKTGDGEYKLINRYPTDGKVYEVRLGAP